mgnify:CR=1 FL=1
MSVDPRAWCAVNSAASNIMAVSALFRLLYKLWCRFSPVHRYDKYSKDSKYDDKKDYDKYSKDSK